MLTARRLVVWAEGGCASGAGESGSGEPGRGSERQEPRSRIPPALAAQRRGITRYRRNGAGAEWGPRSVPQKQVHFGAVVSEKVSCGTMRHHDGVIILPLPRLSSTVTAGWVLAIGGTIRAARVPAQMALRLSFNSERAGAITIRGMPRSAERYRRSFAARSPSAPGMEVFPGLEEDYIKNGRSHANLAGTGPGVCGRRKPA